MRRVQDLICRLIGLAFMMYPHFFSLVTCFETALAVVPRSSPTRCRLTKVLPVLSAYEQNATRTRIIVGVTRGSLIALIGTIEKLRKSLGFMIAGFICLRLR
jgi:hypothetical protein